MGKYKKQIIIGTIIAIMIIVSVPTLLRPKQTEAFLGFGDITFSTTIGDIPNMIWRAIDKGLEVAGRVTFKNMVSNYANNLAYNYAVKLATGEKGQKPLFFDLSTVLDTALDQAAGEFATELLTATSGGGKCQYTTYREIACTADVDCPMIAQTDPAIAKEFRDNKDDNQRLILPAGMRFADNDFNWLIVENEEQWNTAVIGGWAVNNTLQRDKCQMAANAKFVGIDICSIGSPSAEIVIKTIGLNTSKPQPPRCTFTQLKQNFEDLRNIDTGGLIRVSEQFNSRSNEIGIIQHITSGAIEERSAAIAQKGLEVETGEGIAAVESKVTGQTKTPSAYIKEGTIETFVKNPIDTAITFTDDIVADAIGVFTNTLASKMLQQIFDKGLDPSVDGGSSNFRLGGVSGSLSGVAAARLKFADLQKLSDIKTRQRDPGALIQQLTTGCSLETTQTTGVGTVRMDALRETNNCIVDQNFGLAIQQGLTVGEAINYRKDPTKQQLIDPSKDFGFHADGSGAASLAGLGCDGCDPEIISLRSILILRKYNIVPVGWELAARYIGEVMQPEGKNISRNLKQLVDDYGNPDSPFYRLVDPDWQLKASPSIKEVRGPGERIIASYPVPRGDTNEDGRLDALDEVDQVVQRGQEASDEQTCIYENEDGTCAYWGYCTEQKPVWRIFGQSCGEQFNTCQTMVKGGTDTLVHYLTRTADVGVCEAANAGCRRYLTAKDDNGQWAIIDAAGNINNNPDDNVFAHRGAAECNSDAAGCTQYLRLTDVRGNILTADEVSQIITDLSGGDIADYSSRALAQSIYMGDNAVDCRGTEDLDGDGSPDEAANVACQMFTPTSYNGPDIPGVLTPATLNDDGVITAYNDECPSECVGYQPYEEAARPVLYPNSGVVNMMPDTAEQCSLQDVGCTEFTNLNDIAQGGESLEYYSQLRQCTTEGDSRLETYFTWEGSDETGFQLVSWRLVSDGSGPTYATNADIFTECSAAVYNRAPDDPAANPDCREFIDADLNRYYRLASYVVVGTDECQPLRRTLTDINYDGIIDNNDCLEPGELEANGCVYYGLPEQSLSCSANAVGCRQYKGFGSGNVEVLLNETFESGGTAGWTGALDYTNNSITLGGHSVTLGSSASHVVTGIDRNNYVLTFWASDADNSASPLNFYLEDQAGNRFDFQGSVTPTRGWQVYAIGPAVVDTVPSGDVRLVMQSPSGGVFIDNISLAESKDRFLISQSWTTPLSCDVTIGPDSTNPNPHPGSSTESQLYCEAYRDDDGQRKYIKNFTRLCQDRFVGCEALVNTHNSDSNGAVSYAGGASALDDYSSPADEIAYLVNDPNKYCKAFDAGCTELGLRTVSRDGEISVSERYRVLDPDLFENSLCAAEAELCEEYTPAGGAGGFPQFFKDPQDRVCVYRTNVLLPGEVEVTSGWFKLGANPLTVTDRCQGGDFPDNETTAPVCNFDYAEGRYIEPPLFEDTMRISYYDQASDPTLPRCYTYQCDADLSSCSEYQDPTAPEQCDKSLPAGEDGACDYYYFLRDTLDDGIAECRGQVDQGLGCIGFYETERGADSKYLRADCQANCPLILNCYDSGSDTYGGSCSSDLDCGAGQECRGVPVREYPNCNRDEGFDNPNSKPGCIF